MKPIISFNSIRDAKYNAADVAASVSIHLANGREIMATLSASQAMHLGRQLLTAANDWFEEHRNQTEKDILDSDESKLEVLNYFQANGWAGLTSEERHWVFSRVVHFDYNPNGPQYDNKIVISSDSKIGAFLSEMSDGHLMFDFFELEEVVSGQ